MRSAIYQSADGTTAVWDGERVSTAFVESTVNTVVGKRFSKRQQMRRSKPGAHLIGSITAEG